MAAITSGCNSSSSSKAGITNSHTSAITGNIGASPITAAAMDNLFCTEITGIIYGADAGYTGSGDVACFKGEPADSTLVANAVLDMGTAYNDAAGRTTPDHTELHAGDISGQTLEPGLYKWGIDASFAGIVLAIKAITVNTGTTMNGRLFSQTAVTLEMNTITQLPHPCNDKPSCYITLTKIT